MGGGIWRLGHRESVVSGGWALPLKLHMHELAHCRASISSNEGFSQ